MLDSCGLSVHLHAFDQTSSTGSMLRMALSCTYVSSVYHASWLRLKSIAHISQAKHGTDDCLQVGNNGGIEGLIVDTAGRYISSSYAQRISLHEAGHFLIAYLIGLLPKVYTLSTLDAVQRSVVKEAATPECCLLNFCSCSKMHCNVICGDAQYLILHTPAICAWNLHIVLSN